MAIPAAPTEANGDKISFLTYDSGGGINAAAVMRAVAQKSVNSADLAWLGIATHADAATWAANDGVVAIAGYDATGTAIRKLLADTTGRLILRPLGGYDAGGSNGFGHPLLLGHATVHGEEMGYVGIASHVVGGAVAVGNPGVLPVFSAGGTSVAGIADTDGRQITSSGYAFGGQRTWASTTTTQASGPNVPARLAKLKAMSSGTTYLGITGVTADSDATHGGWELAQNEVVDIDGITNLNDIFIIGATARTVKVLFWT